MRLYSLTGEPSSLGSASKNIHAAQRPVVVLVEHLLELGRRRRAAELAGRQDVDDQLVAAGQLALALALGVEEDDQLLDVVAIDRQLDLLQVARLVVLGRLVLVELG